MGSDMIRVTGLNSGLDTEAIISAYTSSTDKRITDAKNSLQINKWTQTAWQSMNSKIYSFYSKTLSANRLSSAYEKKKTTTSNSALSVVSGDNAAEGVQTAQIKATASAAYLTGGKIAMKSSSGDLAGELGIEEGKQIKYADNKGNEKIIQIGGEASDGVTVVKTMDDLVKELGKAGINANYDEGNQRLFLSAKASGVESDFNITGDTETLAKLGLASKEEIDAYNKVNAGNEITAGAATKIAGADAKLILNGAEFTSSSNTFNINGSAYTINHMPTDADEKISITTSRDFDGMYDTIKKMISEYSSLVNEMSKMYNADSSKGYKPLTDEQKDAMTEKEIEEWENKIKDSLLRKNDTLNDVMNTLTNATNFGLEIDGKKVYLSDFGISTLGYFESDAKERYALHIDGDADDEKTAGKDDKLKAAIAADPDKVIKFFTGFAQNMYKEVYSKMGTSSLSSIYKVYNDKQLASEQKDWESKITDLESKLKDIEDKYYKKFSAMETTLAKINSKSSSFGAYLGNNQ